MVVCGAPGVTRVRELLVGPGGPAQISVYGGEDSQWRGGSKKPGRGTRSGKRAVPIITELRPILIEHLMATGRGGNPNALVLGQITV